MKKILIDSKCHQAIRHTGTETAYSDNPYGAGTWKGLRLTGLQADLRNKGFEMILGDICKDLLKNTSVLVIAGRRNSLLFTEHEMEAIETYYLNGTGLLLMANHKGFVAPQNQIAKRLKIPVTFHEATITTLQPSFYGDAMHPTLNGCNKGLRLRTACKMTLESDILVPTVVDQNPEIGIIAAASETIGSNGGPVVVTTSAGHIASLDDSKTDLYASASNATWTFNIIEWLSAGGSHT